MLKCPINCFAVEHISFPDVVNQDIYHSSLIVSIYSYILAPNSRTSLCLDRLSVLKSNDTKAAYAKIIIWVIVIGNDRLVLCIGVDQLAYSQFYERG